MLKATKDYSIYIFDLDGTLYDQPKLRMLMGISLIKYYIVHPIRINELFTLMQFRKVKDNWSDTVTTEVDSDCAIDALDSVICGRVADIAGKDKDYVISIVKRWIYDAPLEALKKAKDDKLCSVIDELRAKGVKVVILSDYPVEDKLNALGVSVDAFYSGTSERIGQLKPSPKGIYTILSDYKIDKNKAYLIGDRMEKDGKAAIAAGIDYLILPRKIRERETFYE